MDDVEDSGIKSRGRDGMVRVVSLRTFCTRREGLSGDIGANAEFSQGQMKLLNFSTTLQGVDEEGGMQQRSAPVREEEDTDTDVYGNELEQTVLGEYGYDHLVAGLRVEVKKWDTACVGLDQ